MASPLDKATVLKRLSELDRHDPGRGLFGAAVHDYQLHPPVAQAEIAAFEAEHKVTLPADYRFFITEIGNGGVGPYYGLFRFGMHDGNADDSRPWQGGDLVGDVSAEFVHTEAWNLPSSFWEKAPEVAVEIPQDEEDRLYEAWDKELHEHYWNPKIMNGAIPICHRGCALRQWLVINGPQRGFVWNDDRADDAGISPLRDEHGQQVTFADWYMAWLTDPDRAMGIQPTLSFSARQTWRERRRDWFQLFLLICIGVLAFAAYLFIRMALGLRLPGDR
jgi:hypothetical protein